MSHELIPVSTPPLIDCQLNPLDETSQVVTIQAIGATTPTVNAAGILASAFFGEGDECVSHLITPPCDVLAIVKTDGLVIGSQGGFPEWQKGNWFLNILDVADGGTLNPNVDNIDVYVYSGSGTGSWTLDTPTDLCSRNHIYIKNNSGGGGTLHIQPVPPTDIDANSGSASYALAATQFLHRVYNPVSDDWMLI
jgi:hypothetical protein